MIPAEEIYGARKSRFGRTSDNASLEKSRNSLKTQETVGSFFMLPCDRAPVMLTCSQQLRAEWQFPSGS
jgi:hypothetical protein